MPSGVKGINQQQIRGVTTGQNIPTSASIQLLNIQKSRNIPAQVQFAARGLVTPQRGTVKIATPISAGKNLFCAFSMKSIQIFNSFSLR